MSSISPSDFFPVNRWQLDSAGPKWRCCLEHRNLPLFLIDGSTQRRYLNESEGTVRLKCFLLTLGTPFVHTPAALCNVAFRVAKVVSGSHFWGEAASHESSWKRLAEDLLRIAAAPLSIVGAELAAVYGLFRPYDGRKLYATVERAEYGDFVLAPCFQPEAASHLLGGDINKRNAY